ncbi:S8 family serine peptidase [Halobacteriovorax sp. JY17]|uniref:S8 family serine peptidase n=1 Tax=Halobacteriovorax sp. JY17 TaxID=2014617 RepID=UPI000C4698A9|nr:S8 family serine peptidase [Halobacteriovorax sp. JY17]PIK15717.1 MAG: hypothetical protein CES88_03030 [Halobacteriovorax sp. JY17]
MRTKLAQILLISAIGLGCDKSPASDTIAPKKTISSQRSFECIAPSFDNNFDIDSCAISACEYAGGEFRDDGCECSEGRSFVYEEIPKCLEVEKIISIDRNVRDEHELINYSIFTEENLYSTSVYNFDLSSIIEETNFANFVAPNFLTLYYLEDQRTISKEMVSKSTVLPNVFIRKSFGDISPIESVRFHSSIELSEEAPYYSQVIDYLGTNFNVDESYYYSDKGCLEHCKKVMHILDGDLVIKRTREFFKGILAFDYITIREEELNILSARYDLLGRTILVIDKGQANNPIINYQLYSFSMKASGENLSTIVDESNDLRIKTAKKYNWGNVVLCDNGILPNDKGNSKNVNLQKGPNQNSVYGWLTDVADQSDYLNGVVNLNELGSGVKGASSHARAVFNYMNMVNVASISLNSCLHDFNNWAPNTFKEGFRVVNYSYSDYLDKNACLTNHIWSEVDKNPLSKEMLWVFAAGNEKSYLTPETATLCPQNILAKRENVLIVGSDLGFGGVSNRGEKYVDIFADAPSTSTATAIISSLAGNIAKKYPDLEVSRIRRAIMASAEDEGLPSRSKGRVDSDRAFKAADLLSKKPRIDNYKLLKEVHCNGRSLFCSVDESWTERF